MLNKFVLGLSLLFAVSATAQAPYQFKSVKDLEATPVISQGNTGTCWSFSSISFFESEIMRINGKQIDLSEMYQVRNTYPKKAENYVMRQGKAQFGEGGLAHDVIGVQQHGRKVVHRSELDVTVGVLQQRGVATVIVRVA